MGQERRVGMVGDIGAWLRGLGLGHYEPAFRDNDIDAALLPTLTMDELRELGVASLGHRKRLMAAIAALAGEVADPQPSPASPGPPTASTALQAERRQLTVMFVDLVDSTALARALDPEEMREVIRAYQNAVAGEVKRFDGYLASFMGDGVLAYFGWPYAHEDDAERAVRAGLAAVETTARLRPPGGDALAARVGIATGLVVVGELIGEETRERAVVGDTPNLAARLQALAAPGSVVIAPGTHRLVGGLFELEDLGTHRLKGLVEPVQVWRAVGASAAESRFEALHEVAGLTPLVGRKQEIALLLDRWQQAKEGEGQVVLLSGEGGVGKSRLVRSLRERLADEPYMPLSHYCSPFHQTSALHPVIDLLERAAGFTRADPPWRKLDKLEALLARATGDVAEAAPLFAALLTIDAEDRYPPLTFAPQRQKERTLEALAAQLEGLAARHPMLVVYEDVHWSDPTTLELLELVIERVQRLPVLALVTFRPEFTPPWPGQAHLTALTLSRLSRRRSAALITALTGGKALPAEVLEQILAKTEGVPLFAEELTKAVLESGLLRDTGDRYELTVPLPPLAIPVTLHDSLLARLGRLAPVKEVAQIGAVIGREFSHELLAAVAPLGGNELKDALDHLVQAELVSRRGTPPETIYSFKHALVRDAAYESLLRSKRQQLHARIAKVLEERFPETVETAPELLAQHWTEAGLAERAIDYWQRAGQRALARSATTEAVAQLTRGLDLLAALPNGRKRGERELDLQLMLGSALVAARGHAAPETARAYARARQLCAEAGASQRIFPALFGQFLVHFQRAELAVAHEVGSELLRLARDMGDVSAQVTAHRAVGAVASRLGGLAQSRAHLEEGLALYDPERDRVSGLAYALDSRVVCLHWLAHVLLALGYPEEAQARKDEALAWARELAHPNSVAGALFCACSINASLRLGREAEAEAEVLIALATEQGFPVWLSAGTVFRGWALADGGQAEEGIADVCRGLADYSATEAELWSPDFQALLAEAHGRAGQAAAGLSVLADALDRVERTGARWHEAELQRRRGELLLALPRPDQHEAETCFRQALAVAREQGARMWELRAATSLGRLWRDQGKGAAARDLLAPIHGRFGPGSTPDLKAAKALLDALE